MSHSNKKFHLFQTLLITLAILFGVLLTIAFYTYRDSGLGTVFAQEDVKDYMACKDKNLFETSQCLREYIRPIYRYERRNDTIKSIEDLKLNGGDCFDWNTLYERMARDLGYTGTSTTFKTGPVMHRVAIISNHEGYCLMDQLLAPHCTYVTQANATI